MVIFINNFKQSSAVDLSNIFDFFHRPMDFLTDDVLNDVSQDEISKTEKKNYSGVKSPLY